ncbi:MAG TPA: PfkB family carbohydrate kinase, partial [Thermomicrobiales bacterium]|nr:PfkB family carbohydrate kinase [Thermomicrobiales bacterium]
VSGSIAFDHIMRFPGSFRDYILPDKAHVLSVSFLFDSLVRLRGGVAGNVAFNLALLGERPALVGVGGSDFADYRAVFEQLGVDMRLVRTDPESLTGSSFMSTDLSGNQIAGFYPGASRMAADISVASVAGGAEFGVVGPTTLEAMRRHVREFHAAGCRLIYDPSQQVVALPAADLREGIELAWAVIGSDYEFAVMEQKTGLTIEDIVARVPFVGVTYGAQGSQLHWRGERFDIPIVPAEPLVDPTGGGDAYRAGLLKGLLLGLPLPVVGRIGALAATYAIERFGTQEHRYDADAFAARFDKTFPEQAGSIDASWFREPARGHALALDAPVER